jgi:hypothetical protein
LFFNHLLVLFLWRSFICFDFRSFWRNYFRPNLNDVAFLLFAVRLSFLYIIQTRINFLFCSIIGRVDLFGICWSRVFPLHDIVKRRKCVRPTSMDWDFLSPDSRQIRLVLFVLLIISFECSFVQLRFPERFKY